MKKYIKPVIIAVLIFALTLATDLVTKVLFDNKNITLLKGVFNIVSSHNTGAGFSLFSNQVPFLIIVTVLFLIAFTVFNIFDKDAKNMLWLVSVVLVYSGCIGNLIDRVAFGYVRDFLYFELINFPIFNVAAMCLVIGVGLYLFNVLFYSANKNKQKDSNHAA